MDKPLNNITWLGKKRDSTNTQNKKEQRGNNQWNRRKILNHEIML